MSTSQTPTQQLYPYHGLQITLSFQAFSQDPPDSGRLDDLNVLLNVISNTKITLKEMLHNSLTPVVASLCTAYGMRVTPLEVQKQMSHTLAFFWGKAQEIWVKPPEHSQTNPPQNCTQICLTNQSFTSLTISCSVHLLYDTSHYHYITLNFSGSYKPVVTPGLSSMPCKLENINSYPINIHKLRPPTVSHKRPRCEKSDSDEGDNDSDEGDNGSDDDVDSDDDDRERLTLHSGTKPGYFESSE